MRLLRAVPIQWSTTGLPRPSGGGGGSCPPGNRGKKVPFLRAGALFLMPNHQQQQGALLNLGLPPSNFRLRTAMQGSRCVTHLYVSHVSMQCGR